MNNAVKQMLGENEFDFIKQSEKDFIAVFAEKLENMGYTFGDKISDGFCWGKYMLIFKKANSKSKNVVARIYIREDSIVLRLFLNNVSKHSKYISSSPDFIKSVFTGDFGNCKHCRGEACKFKKEYNIDGIKYEKCNGLTFEFFEPTEEKLPEYIKLFAEFYPPRKA